MNRRGSLTIAASEALRCPPGFGGLPLALSMAV